MAAPEFSFAPDRRSFQGLFFRFNDRSSRLGQNLTQQESLTYKLSKEYETKFPDVDANLRAVLVDLLVSEVPLVHNNLTFLAVARYIIYYMNTRLDTNELTPELFEQFFTYFSSRLLPSSTSSGLKKDASTLAMTRANFKVTLLRYIDYIQRHRAQLSSVGATTGSTEFV